MPRLLPLLLALAAMLALAPASARADDAPQLGVQALSRFYDGGNLHWESVTSTRAGFAYERTIGYLLASAGPDRRAIYSCEVVANGDHFLTGDSACEGQGPGALQGYVYTSQPATPRTVPLNRCMQGQGYHFASESPTCEGNRVEGTLGYMRDDSPELIRFYDPSTNRHWTGDDGSGGAQFRYEFGLGRLFDDPGPGRAELFFCAANGDAWVTRDGACPGAFGIGYVLTAPSPDVQTVPLYRCVQTGITRFNSTRADCEGQTVEEMVGYTQRSGTALQRFDNPTTLTTQTTSGIVEAGFRYADTLGFVQGVGGRGLQPLYDCATGADHGLSLDRTCGGQTVVSRVGYTFTASRTGTRELFACAGAGRRFASTDSRCGGATVQGSLGWIGDTESVVSAPACGTSTATVPSSLGGKAARTVAYGIAATISGQAFNAAGQPAGPVALYVLSSSGATLATATAAGDGRFTIKLPGGANRTVRVGFRASADDDALACGPALRITVRASVTVHAPRSVRRGRKLRLTGRVKGVGAKQRKTVVLQAYDRKRWRTFKTIRTSKGGRYATTYRFSRRAARKRYPFRAVATTERGFPYAKGTSRTRKVRVR